MIHNKYWILLLSLCCTQIGLEAASQNDFAISTETGIWSGLDMTDHHVHDPDLAKALHRFFLRERAHIIADFGCGLGNYVEAFRKAGIVAYGFDGNPDTPILTQGLCSVVDFSQRVDLGVFDWVLSLEVGEHLPPQYESIFLDNLCSHAKEGIVLSWAVKGQGGEGHFNTRDNDYIKARMAERGWHADEAAEAWLRRQASLSWFKKSLMVFRPV